jgi:hypothetical protein
LVQLQHFRLLLPLVQLLELVPVQLVLLELQLLALQELLV